MKLQIRNIFGGSGVFRTLAPLFFAFMPVLLSASGPEKWEYRIEKVYNHDRSSYTQGLFVENGVMYESSGQYGHSSFRKVDLGTGRVLARTDFPKEYFVEGSCVLDGILYILTWNEETCFVYDLATMTPLANIRYSGEGWGITTDGRNLIMSDGSSRISFRDPSTFEVLRTVDVMLDGKKLNFINELEYIDGMIWANVYLTDRIAIIDPSDGKVVSLLDLADLYPVRERIPGADVLNGIAYDKSTGKIYVTGKLWPKLFEISVFGKKR